jgi:hypothetical protein
MADEDATRRKRDATASAKREESREAKVKAKKDALKNGKRQRTSAGSVFESWS